MNSYTIGDMVLVPRGQKTRFFEIVDINKDELTISNGWIEIKKNFRDVNLICKKENRQDKTI